MLKASKFTVSEGRTKYKFCKMKVAIKNITELRENYIPISVSHY